MLIDSFVYVYKKSTFVLTIQIIPAKLSKSYRNFTQLNAYIIYQEISTNFINNSITFRPEQLKLIQDNIDLTFTQTITLFSHLKITSYR